MSTVAAVVGLDPRTVADLDEDEFDALVRAAREQQWTNVNEGLAATVEALWAILARLDAGLPVVQVEHIDKPRDMGRYPRPDWVEPAPNESVVVVTNLRQAVELMKGAPRD